MMLRSLAAAQTLPIPGDVEANVEQHLRLVRIAGEHQVQVLVCPELSLTGYELQLACGLAFSQDDSRLAPLVEAASRHSMTLVAGAPVRLGSRLHIGAFILTPDRNVAVYTKHHLGAFSSGSIPEGKVPPAEATVFDPGDRNPLVGFGGDVAAVAVCADIGHPSHPQAAADRGAKVYLASMFVVPPDIEAECARLRAYAVRHSMVVAFANYGGPSAGLPSGGRSAIWSETGALLARLDPAGLGIVIAAETPAGWSTEAIMLAGS